MRIATSDRVFRANVGGNSTYATNVYSRLGQMGVEHVQLSPKFAPTKSRIARGIAYATFEGWQLPRLADRAGVDILHYTSDTGGLMRPSKAAVVATIHGMASLHVPSVRNPAEEAVWRLRAKQLARIADIVITDSQSSAADVMAGLGVHSSRLRVIPLGVDRSLFAPMPEAKWRAVALKYRLPEQFILYVGNIEPRKNISRLIRAMASDRLARYNVPLVIVGRLAWDYDGVLREIQSSRLVRYLGPCSTYDVAALMNGATCFVFPSLYEGFGLPVVEAMACGTPVVTSHAGSLAEVAGEAACIVDPVRPDSIAAGILSLLNDGDYRGRLIRSGLVNASRFTWDATAEAHYRLFTDLCTAH